VTVPTTDELRETLVAILTGAAGGSVEKWRKAVGEVTYLPLAANVRSNWSIEPQGSARDRETIAKAAEVVRAEHPYVTRG
jgi:hypothetical protein